MSPIIKQATQTDVFTLTELIRASYQDVAKRFQLTLENAPTHPSNCQEQWIESALKKGIGYYILYNNQIPCGCVALEHVNPQLCYLERLGVTPQNRRKGVGQALVEHTFQQAKQRGTLRVEIGIISEDIDLMKWYQKIGFSVKETAYFPHLPFEVTFMFADL